MSGQIQDEAKLFASVEGQKLHMAKITLDTVIKCTTCTSPSHLSSLPHRREVLLK